MKRLGKTAFQPEFFSGIARCRRVAQLGRALRSGRRGRRFKSCRADFFLVSLLLWKTMFSVVSSLESSMRFKGFSFSGIFVFRNLRAAACFHALLACSALLPRVPALFARGFYGTQIMPYWGFFFRCLCLSSASLCPQGLSLSAELLCPQGFSLRASLSGLLSQGFSPRKDFTLQPLSLYRTSSAAYRCLSAGSPCQVPGAAPSPRHNTHLPGAWSGRMSY